MHRRTLLAGVSLPGLSVLDDLAALGSAREQADESDADPLEPPASPDEPTARAVLGSPSEGTPPHRIRLWNRADERVPVELAVDSSAGDVSVAGSYDLAAESYVAVVLHGRDRYAVSVTTDEAEETIALEESSFDDPCPATEIFVLEEGDVESTTESEADHCRD